MRDRVNMVVILAVITVCYIHLASGSVHYGPASARPTAPATDVHLSDSSENTCAAFNYSSSGAKVTKVRLDRTLPRGTSRLTVIGHNLACTPSSAALYVLPIAATDSGRWHGLFTRCRLIHANPDTANPQRCSFDCDCPDGGCTQIQLSHVGGTAMAGWQLCLVAPDEALTSLDGVLCVASSQYSDQHTCSEALDGGKIPGTSHEWAGRDEVDGIWMRIDFPTLVVIRTISLWPRCARNDQFRTISIATAESDPVRVNRLCNGGIDYSQCDGVGQEDYLLSVRPSNYVKVTGYDACWGTGHAGLREIIVRGYRGV